MISNFRIVERAISTVTPVSLLMIRITWQCSMQELSVQECTDEAIQGGQVCRQGSQSMYLEPEVQFILCTGRTMDESLDALGNLLRVRRGTCKREMMDVRGVRTRNARGQSRYHNRTGCALCRG